MRNKRLGKIALEHWRSPINFLVVSGNGNTQKKRRRQN